MAAIMFFYGIYLLWSLQLFTTWVINPYGVPHVGIVDNDWGGGLVSFGISVYFGMELLGMAAKADEYEHFLDEVMTGFPT
jgi:hypothetical protein